MTQRVLIVDDEPPARERLQRLVAEIPGCEVVGCAGDGAQAVRVAGELKPDAVLLEVRMPGMNGLEAARHLALLAAPPAVIFTTAYDSYAVDAFEAQAVGYLLKPVRAEKLAAALVRAQRLAAGQLAAIRAGDPARSLRTHVAARLGESVKLVPVDEVYCFIAEQKYTTVRHAGGTDLIDDPLRALEDEFGERFLRVHRNALVAVRHLAGLERDEAGQYQVRLRGMDEPVAVSRRLAGELRERLGL